MIVQRLQGVMRQYGPTTCFFVGEIVLERTLYLSPLLYVAEGGEGTDASPYGPTVRRHGREQQEVDFPPSALASVLTEELARSCWPIAPHQFLPGAVPLSDDESLEDRPPWMNQIGAAPLLAPLARTVDDLFLPHGHRAIDGDEVQSKIWGLTPWIARMVHAWLKRPRPRPEPRARGAASSPPALEPYVLRHLRYYRDVLWICENLIEIADWAAAKRPDLLPMSLRQVKAAMARWRGEAHRVAEGKGPRPESPVVFEHGGYRVLELVTRDALVFEGAKMRHCVADYWRGVQEKHTCIYAVIDARGRSKATIEAGVPTDTGRPRVLRQERGFANATISHPGLRAAIEAFYAAKGISRMSTGMEHRLLEMGAELIRGFLLPMIFGQPVREDAATVGQRLLARAEAPPSAAHRLFR
jgi:hypothetical protein